MSMLKNLVSMTENCMEDALVAPHAYCHDVGERRSAPGDKIITECPGNERCLDRALHCPAALQVL